jgi:hypothetical protein
VYVSPKDDPLGWGWGRAARLRRPISDEHSTAHSRPVAGPGRRSLGCCLIAATNTGLKWMEVSHKNDLIDST